MYRITYSDGDSKIYSEAYAHCLTCIRNGIEVELPIEPQIGDFVVDFGTRTTTESENSIDLMKAGKIGTLVSIIKVEKIGTSRLKK